MKAMVITDFGGPEVFEERNVAEPVPGPTEILVKVYATSVNPVDYKIRRAGNWAGIEPPAVIGYDVSGVVEAVGDAVGDFDVGDEVFYTPEIFVGPGSYAEYHVADTSIVAPKPPSLSHAEAASLPLAGGIAWDSVVVAGGLQVGETVLIHGMGGVGSLAVQIAKASGARVLAVCSDYIMDRAKELGADVAIDYQSEDFVDVVGNVADGGVDLVLDTVGGDVLERSIAVTKEFGMLVGIVGTAVDLRKAGTKNLMVQKMFLQRARYKLLAVHTLVERGQLEPVIDSVMPLEEVADAHRRLEQGGVKGKIVLQVAE
jgi:NADPH:quinone reductase-like Zn-dependent oxidoreductase